MKTEALKMALEALEGADMIDCDMRDAITAIKEALANVATNDTSQERVAETSESVHEPVIDKSAAVRIATVLGWEPQRKPLTDDEIQNALPGYRLIDAIDIARAIEAAHGIKEEAV